MAVEEPWIGVPPNFFQNSSSVLDKKTAMKILPFLWRYEPRYNSVFLLGQ